MDFLGGSVVKTPSFHCRELNDLIPVWGTVMNDAPGYALQPNVKKKEKQKKSVKTILSLRAVREEERMFSPSPHHPHPRHTPLWAGLWFGDSGPVHLLLSCTSHV